MSNKVQTQPVPIRIDSDVLLVLLAVLLERQGGSATFAGEEINAMASSGKTLRVLAEALKDPFGNVIYNLDNITPVIDEQAPMKVILHQLKPAKGQENSPNLVGPEGGLVN